MSIKETIKAVKPLKITSIICETYCAVYTIIRVVSNNRIGATNLDSLAGLAALAFVVTALAALIISRVADKNN